MVHLIMKMFNTNIIKVMKSLFDILKNLFKAIG